MFVSGEYVVHSYNGLCLVENVTHLNMSGINKDALYYILRPLNSEESKIYLPVDSDKMVSRRIMTKEEAAQFLEQIDNVELFWNPNHKFREEMYKTAMKTCDCRMWIRIIKTLYLHQKEREAIGKRISASDERFLKHAEEYLFQELSLATGETYDEMRKQVMDKIMKKEAAAN